LDWLGLGAVLVRIGDSMERGLWAPYLTPNYYLLPPHPKEVQREEYECGSVEGKAAYFTC
jgi:hypothetical protein